MDYTKFDIVNLQQHSELNEKWVQKIIAKDPNILGLGDVILKDQERIQPKAGRLDLLLQEANSNRRYEVELQLGASDESHIIRTIEYWDIEKRRYPQYDHCAVIIAEDITSRFLNVISLFNGHIPIIALQMTAISHEGKVGLIFTRVLDELNLGMVEEDETISEPTDRPYWIGRANNSTLKMTDTFLGLIQEVAPDFELNYNKHYIGLAKDGRANNFISFVPRRQRLEVRIKLRKSNDFDELITQSDLDELEYDRRYNQYRLRLTDSDMQSQRDILNKLIAAAWTERSG